jgi:Na+(H+)/acetate symporter ActP
MNFGRMVSLVLAIVAVLGVFVEVPIVSDYAFWILVGAVIIWHAVHTGSTNAINWGAVTSLVLLLVAIVGVFVEIPIVSDYAFLDFGSRLSRRSWRHSVLRIQGRRNQGFL